MTEFEFLRQATWLANRRSYKPSWCYVVYFQKYGRWPSKKLLGEVSPMPPSGEFWDCLVELWGVDAVERVRVWLRAMWKDVDGDRSGTSK